jgi:hypothetical protein
VVGVRDFEHGGTVEDCARVDLLCSPSTVAAGLMLDDASALMTRQAATLER